MKKVLLIILLVLIGIFGYIFFTYEQLKYYEKILNEVEEIEVSIADIQRVNEEDGIYTYEIKMRLQIIKEIYYN